MQTNLQFLFDLSKFEKRKTPIQSEFEETNLELLLAFKQIVYDSHSKLHSYIHTLFRPGEMDRNQSAVSMSSFMRQGILFKLISPNNENIYIKKLDHKKRPSNIQTINNNLIIFQLTKSSKDVQPNIFLGYTANENYSIITGIYAVCIEGKAVKWITNISLLGGSAQAQLESITPIGGSPKLKDGIVKLKKSKKKNE